VPIGLVQPIPDTVVTAVLLSQEVLMRKPLMIAACAVMLASLAACHQEGPAEKAGSSLDRAGEKVQDTLNPPQGPAQKAGRSIDRALGD
jgi:predicted small lipoprotein YifL